MPFLAISYLSLTVITISWNVLTRRLGADTQGRVHTLSHTDLKSMTDGQTGALAAVHGRHILTFPDAHLNFKRTSKVSSIQIYAV